MSGESIQIEVHDREGRIVIKLPLGVLVATYLDTHNIRIPGGFDVFGDGVKQRQSMLNFSPDQP